uniref:GG11736 n=1 Tax=Drosophila erecta TaxID=7220 RepID=B3P7X2_DROER
MRRKPSFPSFLQSLSTTSTESRKTIQFGEYPRTVELADGTEERPKIKRVPQFPTGRSTPVDNTQVESRESSRELNNPEEYPYVVEIPEQEEEEAKRGSQSAKSKIK